MPVGNESSTRFRDEIRIISPWAYFIAALGYVAAGAAVVFSTLTNKGSGPFFRLPLNIVLGLAAGTVIACYVLLIGYINRDAGRRGMNRLGWTLLAIFIPNGLGIVLYFVLRKALAPNCPQCQAIVESGFGFCPCCCFRLTPVCAHCQHIVHINDKFCPYCGCELATGKTVSTPVPHQS
jgi:RNA polymerase subunit RPABC4/transcription elongation factor Spt4